MGATKSMSRGYARAGSGSPEKSAPNFSAIQGRLFDDLAGPAVVGRANAPALNVWPELLGEISRALREARDAGLSRERIVDRMNAALPDEPRPMTKRQLDAWTASSKEEHRFPLEYLPAFCWATCTSEPLRVLARLLGYELVDARERAAKRLGETQIEIARLRREAGDITRKLGS